MSTPERQILKEERLPVSQTEREHLALGLDVRPEVEAEMFPADHNHELWLRIPENIRDGLRRYMMDFVRPGGFLVSVLENDLAGALQRAHDDATLLSIRDICTYLFNCAPPQCYGDRDAVDKWCAKLVRLRIDDSPLDYIEDRYRARARARHDVESSFALIKKT